VARKMPCGCAAHGETADTNAIFVDGIMFANVFEGFEGVDLADKFVGVAETTVWMQDESVRRGKFAAIVFAVSDETEFAEFGIATVIPEVEAMLMVGRRIERGRDDKTVGLDGAIDFRFVAANDKAGGGVPRRLAVVERASAGVAFVEEFSGSRKIVCGVENVVVEGVADGVEVDLDVWEEILEVGLGLDRFLEIVDFEAESGDAGFQVTLNVGWDWDAFGRHSGNFASGSIGGGG